MKLAACILLLLVSASAKAQYREPATAVPSTAVPYDDGYKPSMYLGLSTGIDNYTGILGLGFQFPFQNNFSLRTGAGIGAWGLKLSGGMKYEDLMQSGWGFGLGYSHCTGLSDFDLTFSDANGNTTRSVNMDLNPAGSLNLTLNKNFYFRGDKLLYLETGYAVPTGGRNLYTINDGQTLTADEDLILQIIRPGGIVLAVGLLIGF